MHFPADPSFIRNKPSTRMLAGWGFSEWRGQECLSGVGGWVGWTVQRLFCRRQSHKDVLLFVDDVDTFISMRLNCRSWHLKDSENEKGEGRTGTRLKVEVFARSAMQRRVAAGGPERIRDVGGRWVGG